MISPTYVEVTLEKAVEIINNYYNNCKKYESDINIIVGTDSQKFSDTKVVIVIAVQCVGHDGIYFYEIQRVKKIDNVSVKLNYETTQSLHYADRLLNELISNEEYNELLDNTKITIHVDAGRSNRGKTKDLIPGIVGWIKSCGYDCEVKTDSFVTSSIADKISK